MSTDNEQKSTGPKIHPPGYGYGNLPSFTKQKFLSVHVPKGSSTSQIAAAVERALESPDVPFFKDRTTSPAPPKTPAPSTSPAPSAAQPPATQQLAMQAGAASPADDGDGLLILVQQEGRP